MISRLLSCVCAIFLFFVIINHSSVPASKAAPMFASVPLRIMSWNVQFGEGTDAITNFDRTAAWIAKNNPDVVGLCEMPAGNVPTLVALLTQKTGRIWYDTLLKLTVNSSFQDAANTTYHVAGTKFGTAESKAVRDAWGAVGVKVS